ncbi:hypothetical protein JHK82_016091 [Glycine max]|nr:hypothetical protein JHK85_016490 [Glycine max]KAG5046713.1 hypothetical protein JHK86_016119 [Glycine max]KAG5149210.1 hypothetical protein JHK82_016091 [Glycine max]
MQSWIYNGLSFSHFSSFLLPDFTIFPLIGAIDACFLADRNKLKLYQFDKDENQWKERGADTMKFLKHKASSKVRLLMRQSKTLKIYANHLILPMMSVQEQAGNEKSRAMDRFHENENGILVATDVAARGLDILGVRIVVHYQLPHSAEGYVHRSGRTTRAFAEGCSIALISSRDTSKFVSLCKSFSKDKKNWFDRNASSLELVTENYDSEEAQVNKHKQMKTISRQLKKLQKVYLSSSHSKMDHGLGCLYYF